MSGWSDLLVCYGLAPESVAALRRLTAYNLAVRGSRMPGAAVSLTLGPDNIEFHGRLRWVHPETEAAMHEQRQACIEARTRL